MKKPPSRAGDDGEVGIEAINTSPATSTRYAAAPQDSPPLDLDWSDDAEDDDDNVFNWVENADVVVVNEQRAIAVYRNSNGGIVIRQERDFVLNHDDVWIVVDPRHAETVARAILAAAKP